MALINNFTGVTFLVKPGGRAEAQCCGAQPDRHIVDAVCGGERSSPVPLAIGLPLVAVPASSQAGASGGKSAKYIISSVSGLSSGALSSVTSAVTGVGSSANSDLSSVGAATAQLSQSQASSLAAVPGVTVTPNLTVKVQGSVGSSGRAPAAVFPEQTGASQLWAQGDTGQGVNVAVLDTGIARCPTSPGAWSTAST